MEIFRVLKPGPQTQIQDLGRYGYLQYGVPPCGVLDQYSSRVANLLAGNSGNEALLEITFQGPRLEVLGRAILAITGADMEVTLNGDACPLWASFPVKPGDILNIGQAKRGLRAYLAVTGGIDVPLIMGSRSTYSAAGFGGYQGRALATGDILACGEGAEGKAGISCPAEFIPPLTSETVLRAIPGPQDYMFEEGLANFFGSTYEVTPYSNRMGYRLEGLAITLGSGRPQSIISEPSLPGGVQVPADGKPIILLLEQTTGGYAKIATVISTDICRVAQARPGDRIIFARISLEEAHVLFLEREARLQKLAGQLRKIA
ncbi:MAG: biotin-dependent carboxyltransferase family protein [Smithellaceae bacterium]|nr:biotin-dependent carboxyltransferase family protein [Smithellaceae bacterium]